MNTALIKNMYKLAAKGPVDAKYLVQTYDELFLPSTWEVIDEDGNIKNAAYNGMLVAVWLDKDAIKNGVYFFQDNNKNNVSSVLNNNPDVTKVENWTKLCSAADLENLVGKKTADGGEIFNDNGNIAISKGGHAEGQTTVAGSKAFNILEYKPPVENVFIGGYVLDSVEGIEVGDIYSLKIENNYLNNGIVVSIDTTTNIVEIENCPTEELVLDEATGSVVIGAKANSFRLDNKPNVGTKDFGTNSHAEGRDTKALGDFTHTEGYGTIALGRYAHAEGNQTNAYHGAHSEGEYTNATGNDSHAEGHTTIASGFSAHAEGNQSEASGNISHAEGYKTKATNSQAHAEGQSTSAEGLVTHAEGFDTHATGDYSHSEGQITNATKQASHSEGYKTNANASFSHAEGCATTTTGAAAHAEGESTNALGQASHAEGKETTVNSTSIGGHAEGGKTTVNNNWGHAEGYNTTVSGDQAHAEGQNSIAYETASHAEGFKTEANGMYAHAEGESTYVAGQAAHAEGQNTKAIAVGSHAEGFKAKAYSAYSHAEGAETVAGNANAHSEGYRTHAFGDGAHSEGHGTQKYENSYSPSIAEWEGSGKEFNAAIGIASHTEGTNNFAAGRHSHAEGIKNMTSGDASHAEGELTQAKGNNSHTEGNQTFVESAGIGGHAEGGSTKVFQPWGHAEGYKTTVNGSQAHAEGQLTEASGTASHAEGFNTRSIGVYSHSEGYQTVALGTEAHAEGRSEELTDKTTSAEIEDAWLNGTTPKNFSAAVGTASHVEGTNNVVLSNYGHAEGLKNIIKANGSQAHVEGYDNVASHGGAHVEGLRNTSCGDWSHVQGKYNAPGNFAHVVGGGTGTAASQRKNIHTIDWNGNAEFAGSVKSKGKELATENYVNESIKTLIGGAPEALDTLKEITDFLGTPESENSVTIVEKINNIDKKLTNKLDANGWTTSQVIKEDGYVSQNILKCTGNGTSVQLATGSGLTVEGGPTSLTYGPDGIRGGVDADTWNSPFEVTYYGITVNDKSFDYPARSGTLLVDKDIEALQNRVIELEAKLNEVETALDRIIQIQNQLMGGN